MAVKIYPVGSQIKGGFNGGEILENKPIQLSEDESKLQPYSNIFYWAHAWATVDSTIGLHPHQGFEIMSFVLKGSIEHYDTKNKTWIPLKAGDVQIIRAGKGISHAEKVLKDAHIFQIWFDPNLSKTIRETPTYDDYGADSFPVKNENGFSVKTFKGDDAPVMMETPGITIRELKINAGDHTLPLKEEEVHSLYVIEGSLKTGNQTVSENDFIMVQQEKEFSFQAEKETTLFIISSPAKTDYDTYASRYN